MLTNFLLFLFLYLGAIQGSVSAFNPLNYPKSSARCMATRRQPVLQDVHIDLSTPVWALSSTSTPNHYPEYVEINSDAPTTLLMVHGWPSLWSSWSKQIEEFQVRWCTAYKDKNKNNYIAFFTAWLSFDCSRSAWVWSVDISWRRQIIRDLGRYSGRVGLYPSTSECNVCDLHGVRFQPFSQLGL